MIVVHAGEVAYPAALSLQESIAERVRLEPDRPRLILLRHPPVFTLGKFGDGKNILDAHGIPVHRVDRGGDVTYHGPGQVVGYPIVSLRAFRIGVRVFVHRIERALIRTLSTFGIEARRREDCIGVWTDRGKIASIGLRVDRGVTRHGFALQVKSEPEPYTYINPCGMPGCRMTSVEEEGGGAPEETLLRKEIVAQFMAQFHLPTYREIPLPEAENILKNCKKNVDKCTL